MQEPDADTIKAAWGLEHLEPLIELFNFKNQRDLKRYCRPLVVHQSAFAALIMDARAGALVPYSYACRFFERTPPHLEPTERDLSALNDAKVGPLDDAGRKFFSKITSIFDQRRLFAAHLFYSSCHSWWHLFYFDQRDRAGDHWKHGPHIHYTCDLLTAGDVQTIWRRFASDGDTSPLRSLHLRFRHREGRGMAFPGPRLAAPITPSPPP